MKRLALVLLALLLASPAHAQSQFVVPPNAPATPIVSAAAEGSHIIKAGPAALMAGYVTTGASAGFFLVFNSPTIPGDGAVTPIHCIQIAANSTVGLNFAPQPPEFYSSGVVFVFSTTGCFTKTISNTAFFHALVQ